LISLPDFAECISDGETVDEALAYGKLARKETIAALKSKDFPVPFPRSGGVASGKFIARVPKTIHAQLANRAKAEGVSLNAIVLTFIAQGLGRKEGRAGRFTLIALKNKPERWLVMTAGFAGYITLDVLSLPRTVY
jgi:antitoxin HicB